MKRLFYIAFCSLILTGIGACNDDIGQIENTDEPKNEESVTLPDTVVEVDTGDQLSDALLDFTLTEEEKVANQAINDFAIRLFAKASESNVSDGETYTNKNFVISPLCATLGLASLANSVDEASTNAILKMLGVNDVNTFNSLCNKLLTYLNSERNGSRLNLANSVWYNDLLLPSKSYIDSMQDLFNADVYCADFEDSKTKNLINQWCSNKTNGKFNGVIDSIDPTTLLMLINAMYFEGIWCSKFDKTKTFESTFDGLNRQSKIDVMSSFMKTECFVTDDYCAIVLYFGLTELYLILPSSDIETFCRTLTPECVNKMIKDKGIYDVNLGLPRFSVGNTADLKPVLTSMGLPEKVYIDKTGIPYIFEADYDISQKTYANFDEDGSVLVSVNFAYMLVGHPWIIDVLGILNVTFDKPFAFFIRNYTTGTILMAGRVCDI